MSIKDIKERILRDALKEKRGYCGILKLGLKNLNLRT